MARGKDFCEELLSDGNVQILGSTKYKEMIRLSTKAERASGHDKENGLAKSRKDLEKIIEAGLYAPNAGGRQGLSLSITKN